MPGHSNDDDSSGQNFHGLEENEDAAAFDDTKTLKTSAAGGEIDCRPHNDMPVAGDSDSDTDQLIGQTIEGRYLIIELIGRGGMGVVYRARQLLLDKIVALKVVLPGKAENQQAVLRFLQEGKAAMQLSHENIVTIREFGLSSDGLLYLAMDFIEGKSLKTIIARESPLSTERVVAIARQICSALQHAHTHGVIHRDIKPANILLTNDPAGREIVKLFDFGVAKLQFEDMKITKTGALVGTPTYMSPEQVTGRQPDARSDIYAVGCTLFEMITGKPPFRSGASMDTFMQHLNDPVPTIERKDVPANLIAIVNRCLSKDPIDRYESALELNDELDKLKPPQKPEVPHKPEVTGETSRSPLFAVFISILLIVIAVVVYSRMVDKQPISNVPLPLSDEGVANTKRLKLDKHTQKLLTDKWRRAYGASQSAFDIGKYDLARKDALECLRLSESVDSLAYKTAALAILADLAYVANDRALNESYVQAYLKSEQMTPNRVNTKIWIRDRMQRYSRWKEAPQKSAHEIETICEICNNEAERRITRGLVLDALELLSVPLRLQTEFEIPAEIRANALSNYGSALARHDTNGALTSLEKALKIYEKTNSKSASLARTYYTIALCQTRVNKRDLAEKNANLALELDKALLGASHPMVVADMAQLAGICSRVNKKAEAERLWKEVIRICGDGQMIASKMENIPTLMAYASSLRGLKRLNDARGAYERTKSFVERAVWKNDAELLVPIFNELDAVLTEIGDTSSVEFHHARVQAMKSRYDKSLALQKFKSNK